jgi:hypothetical protein
VSEVSGLLERIPNGLPAAACFEFSHACHLVDPEMISLARS